LTTAVPSLSTSAEKSGIVMVAVAGADTPGACSAWALDGNSTREQPAKAEASAAASMAILNLRVISTPSGMNWVCRNQPNMELKT
jgi:hypothetical protein